MDEIVFSIEVDEVDGGYTARAIDHGIFTEADDLDTLKAMIRDSVECHFEVEQLPKLIHLNIIRHEVMAL
jgi:hypothetical protein